MDITPIIPKNYNIITGYSKGSFLVNEVRYFGNILLSKEKIWQWGDIDIDNLLKDDFEAIINDCTNNKINNAIILVGGGERHRSPAFKLLHALSLHGLNVEFMTTAAACRTYNILLAEGREVYAALQSLL
jgi:uncharacterized protein